MLHMNSLIVDPYDGLLITWVVNWFIHHPLSLNGNIFFPFQNTLAYSDFQLVSSLTSFPFVLAFNEPLLAFNINYLLGFILTGFSTFLLAKFLTNDLKISLVAGTLFTFGSIHANYSAHLQLFGFWPFVLTLYFYFRSKLTLFLLFFFVTVATMPLFLFFFLAFFAINLIVSLRGVLRRSKLKIILIAFAISSVVFIPYFLVSREFNYVRPLTDTIHFSLTFQQFFRTAGPMTLILIGILIFKPKKLNDWSILALVSFVLAFGPALHIFENTVHVGPLPAIPLPYLLFYYLLPGFSGFRTPSRWLLLAFFALSLVFAQTFKHHLSKRLSALLILIILLQVNFPIRYFQVPSRTEFPPEQIWLSQNYKNAPIIHFPMYGWFNGNKIGIETLRMYYSTMHFHPMFNGFSGFSPKSWEQNVQWLQKEFPSENSLTFIKSQGVKLILTPKMLKSKQVKLLKKFPNTNIYALDSNANK